MTPRYRDSTNSGIKRAWVITQSSNTEAVPERWSPETGLRSVPYQDRVPKMGIRYDGMKYPVTIMRWWNTTSYTWVGKTQAQQGVSKTDGPNVRKYDVNSRWTKRSPYCTCLESGRVQNEMFSTWQALPKRQRLHIIRNGRYELTERYVWSDKGVMKRYPYHNNQRVSRFTIPFLYNEGTVVRRTFLYQGRDKTPYPSK